VVCIQSLYSETRVYTVGALCEQNLAPNDATPASVSSQINGPPLSPCYVE